MTTRIILMGGFLGSGKTTLLASAAQRLAAQGLRVGVVTNDQGQDLVDTALIRHHEIPVTEVAGGCFCCRFPDLLQAIQRLEEVISPDVVLAEPVGSCTDLVATVVRPLKKYHAGQFVIAPLTVLLDPKREMDLFSSTVKYLYRQQLTEADVIVLNKSDLLDKTEQAHMLAFIQETYPYARVMALSAHTGEGVAGWLARCLLEESRAEQVLDVDYALYAQAEATLGWLNARGNLTSTRPFAPDVWADTFFQSIDQDCHRHDISIAHLKLHLKTASGHFKASKIRVSEPHLWDLRAEPPNAHAAEFILNARVNTAPDRLETMVRERLSQASRHIGGELALSHFECFSPLPPQPTYRISSSRL